MDNRDRASRIVKMTAFDRLKHDFAKLAMTDGTPLASDAYLDQLVDQQRAIRSRFRKVTGTLLLLDSAAISYLSGATMPTESLLNIAREIPAAAEILVFVIGVTFASFLMNAISALILFFYHRAIVKFRLGSETPWFAVQHRDAESVWTDLATQRFGPPASGAGHRRLARSANAFVFLAMGLVSFATLLLLAVLFVGIVSRWVGWVQVTIAACGLAVAFLAVLYCVFTLAYPLEFAGPEE